MSYTWMMPADVPTSKFDAVRDMQSEVIGCLTYKRE